MKKAHPIRFILPQILTLLTGYTRYLPEIKWRSNSWIYNAFRIYEIVFWRRKGIRLETTLSFDPKVGVVMYQFHTLEAALTHIENTIRDFFRSFQFVPVKIYIPVLAFANIPQMHCDTPYLLAVAFVRNTGNAGANKSYSVDASSGDFLVALIEGDSASNPVSAATYAGSSMTQMAYVNTTQVSGGNTPVYIYGILAPATGSNTLAITSSQSAHYLMAHVYSGVSQVALATQISNGAMVAGTNAPAGTSSSHSLNLNTAQADSWMVWYVRGGNTTMSAGTGSTRRGNEFGTINSFDSNGTITTGGYTMNATSDGSGGWVSAGLTFAPTGTTTYNQSVDATTELSATVATAKTILSSLSATTAITASVATVKNIVAELLANVAVSASVLKEMAMSLSATTAITADVVAQRVFLQAIDAITAISASIETTVGKVLEATTAVSATLEKTISVSQLLEATTEITASVDAARGIVLEAIATVSASMTTAIGKTLVATITIIGKVSAPFYRTKYPSHEDASVYEVKYPHD